jgi:prepilin-type processing-associated H-X9-DG protein
MGLQWVGHLAFILPQMEQKALYDSINFASGPVGANREGPMNTTAFRTSVPSFICPSDTAMDRWAGVWGMTNYHGNAAWPAANFGKGHETLQGKPRGGIFGYLRWNIPAQVDEWNHTISLREVPDGLSKTALYAEVVRGTSQINGNPATQAHKGSYFSAGGIYWNIDLLRERCKTGTGLTYTSNHAGWEWFLGHKYASMYDHLMTPNRRNCGFDGWHGASSTNASSYHAGGVNVAFGDGNVTFIADAIDENIWEAMGTREGNDVAAAN